jgi:hypothetical protein
MSLVPTILTVWFAGGLLAVLLVGARGLLHDLWRHAVDRGHHGPPGRLPARTFDR